MSNRVLQLKSDWDDRARRLGQTQKSVLFKRFPGWLNNHIHNQHVSFILENIPPQTCRLLDVGCGYGRIAKAIKAHYPKLSCTGVELCTAFAATYEKEIGECFNGAIQDFSLDKTYDAIIIVTLLMYLDDSEHQNIIKKLWSNLNAGGVIICIEPAVEFLDLWHFFTRTESASPTGGSVIHFNRLELKKIFPADGEVQDTMSVRLLPFLESTALHHGLAICKPVDRP